ncbi:hypothetical protein [Marinifilum fragile]|uniref:hypothetical protein n=1 Tax=Marinifilum fragile TaxID=570161 RepID=UPI0006D20BD0|nr:hypothetical protein [Marinifilum fragile]
MNFEIKKNTEFTTINIKRDKVILGLVAFISLLFLGLVYIIARIGFELIYAEINPILLTIIGVFLWAAYYNFFNISYLLIGTENIEIHSNYIKHTKVVWLFRQSKKYLKKEIINIGIGDSSKGFGSIGLDFLGLSTIKVVVNLRKKKRMIGKQINTDQAKRIISEINSKMYATQHAGIKHGSVSSS